MAQDIIDLLAPQYPQICFSTPEKPRTTEPLRKHTGWGSILVVIQITSRWIFVRSVFITVQPVTFWALTHGKHRSGLTCPPPTIRGAFMCIATQSTCQAKYWNNGTGWSEVVAHLKSLGYRVLCIDRCSLQVRDLSGITFPGERKTLPAGFRYRSGLICCVMPVSSLAWPVDCHGWHGQTGIPVVLISGFSLPNSEFYTPWRVFNSHGLLADAGRYITEFLTIRIFFGVRDIKTRTGNLNAPD